ncbi:MAG: hypothetical protein GX442_14430 [Candidatus Riflebacteria bacterium]|nr:hypothetical protein [Candidatus Riflebacteria bacterium]
MSLWIIVDSWLLPLKGTVIWPGLVEVGQFLGTHLISGMIPAFFIAGAINIFLDKQNITRLMGSKANPLVAYPVAALTGGILTVCSCGVIPIFSSVLSQGAGIGPAFTFLLAAPAVNLISLTYTWSLIGIRFTLWRGLLVVLAAMAVGLAMKRLFGDPPPTAAGLPGPLVMVEEDERPLAPTALLFALLLLIMITSTGLFDSYLRPEGLAAHSPYFTGGDIRAIDFLMAKGLLLLTQVLILAGVLWKWFSLAETRLWLNKSVDLFVTIFPKVLLGLFLSGILAAGIQLSDPRLMAVFDTNSLQGNFLAAFIGSLMYFGTIVGVNIVATLMRYGMHAGPAMALTLAGPAVSLPSLLAIVPVVGRHKAMAFFALVVIIAALCGLLFGTFF